MRTYTEIFTDIYADHGCNLAPSCLNCPLELCKYDRKAPDSVLDEADNRYKRDKKIVRLRRLGKEVEKIASDVGISGRTVWRVLARGGPSDRDIELTSDPLVNLKWDPNRVVGIKARRPLPPLLDKQEVA